MTITVISAREAELQKEVAELRAERAEWEHKLSMLQTDSDLVRVGARLVHEKLRRENKELEKKNDALKAECEDHIQQLRKEQLEVQRLHHELAALQKKHPASFAETHPANPDAICKCEHWQACKECHPTLFEKGGKTE